MNLKFKFLKYEFDITILPRTDNSDDAINREPMYLEDIKLRYNPKYGDNNLCICGHIYYRHFDENDEMLKSGCSKCQCTEFRPHVADTEEDITTSDT